MSTVKSNTLQLGQSLTASQNFCWYQPASPDGTVRLGNGNSGSVTDLVTLTSAGNWGLGVTPNTWYSGYTALEFKNYGAITSRAASNSMEILTNAYRNASANYVYKQNGAAQILEMANGAYNFYIASSGTAGATFTPTQAMTLDPNGNLGVGQTSVVNRLDVLSSGSYSAVVDMTTAQLRLKHSTFPVQLYAGVDHASRFAYMQASETGVGYRDLLLQPAGATLLIGTTSQGGAGIGIVNISYNNVYFGLRINTANAGGGSALQFNNSAGTQQGLISTSGVGTTTYGGTSDYRLKENIIPYTGALEVVSKLKPVKFKWIEGFEDNGFIAHELQEVLPNAVQGKKDAINTDGSINPQGIDPRCIVATLTAAIQELSQEIETLKQKVN